MAKAKKTAQGTWRVQIEIAGVRESGTFDTKREADEWSSRRTLELRSDGKAGPGSRKTMLDMLRQYGEQVTPAKRGNAKELIRLKAFEDPTKHRLPLKAKVRDVTSMDLGQWREERLKLNARGTVLRDMGLMSAIFEEARREWKWIQTNPMRDVRKPSNPDHRDRLISGLEARQVLRKLGHTHAEPRKVSQAVAAAFLMALATGMRAGEITGLKWSEVRSDHVILYVTKTKGRLVPLSPVAARLIDRMRGWDPELVFGIGAQTLDALFRKARARAGLEGFTFHDSRHTACTRLARKVDVLDLCKIMGWVKTTQALVYYNPKASDIAKRLA
ncbi:tyrosine-type recombinase/integrase [Variovorax sp. N23]|uniref:tyrosine-type recombinase/integrase n=1 Tax=Variovorax sp. N23 TaxID=2980555 RepID=UPI0021C9FF7C|nr:site-specific integrase [Variovorax sp. N23]MCU4119363.1 site-specific integrase [Variovorax sp. N23]